MARIELQAAKYMVAVAQALESVQSSKLAYGEFHLTDVPIHFDNEPTEYRVIFDGDGAIWLEVGDSP